MTDSPKIELEHFYPNPPSEVWKCLTIPELHAQWWAPGEVKAEVGASFDLDMGNFGYQTCEVLEVQPERLFKYLFSPDMLGTTITWLLIPENGGTRLRLTQEGFDFDSPIGGMAYSGLKSGWPDILAKMKPGV